MKSYLKYLSLIWFILSSAPVMSQCWLSLSADSMAVDSVEICTGDSVTLSLSGECILIQSDFNDGSIGPGWSYITPGLLFQSPCDTADEIKCAWFGEGSQVQRIMETVDLDLTPGGDIAFDLKFGIQGDPPSCEGPDEMMEGVSLQYSLDHGQTWIDITYFCPDGTFLSTNPMVQSPLTYTATQFTNWASYSFSIPLAAQTPSTRFRWVQSFCSYFNNHFDDNWGLDNVKITRVFSQFIQWSMGANTLGPVIVNPTTTTTYSVYILGGAIPPDTLAIDYIVVNVHPVPQVTFTGDTEICAGDITTLESHGPYNFLWSTGSDQVTIQVQPYTTTLYTITATDDLGCKGTGSLTVLVHPLPQASIIPDTICYGESGMISASGGVFYVWNTGEINPQIIVQPDVSSLYSVTVTDQFGCSNQTVTEVVVNPLPSVYLTPDTAICYGGKISLIAGGGEHYFWNTGSHAQYITVGPLAHTSYTVTVVDAEGCQNTATSAVFVSPEYEAKIISDKDTVCRGAETVLTASGGEEYLWSTGDNTQSIIVIPPFTSYYAVTVTNTFNGTICPAETVFLLNVEECSTVFFPNAFSPKGYNPEFKPVGDFSAIYNYSLQIFDRWGKLLFESKDPGIGWNGQFQSEFYPAGVYTYRVTFIKSLIDQSFEKVGAVILVE
ncbi:MAG: gliding motility-associated C-terminal domain-containing protein [Bacteroidales bacterium]